MISAPAEEENRHDRADQVVRSDCRRTVRQPRLGSVPVMNMLADKLLQKYQTASCQQLAPEHAKKQGQPKPQREQELVTMMRNDPQMRAAFIDKVAAPIANKMFECGMIP